MARSRVILNFHKLIIVSISFVIALGISSAFSQSGSVAEFIAWDADTNARVSVLAGNDVIDGVDVARKTITFTANPVASLRNQVRSAVITVNGEARTENFLPYTAYGDSGGRFNGRGIRLSEGNYALSVVYYSLPMARGQQVATDRVNFTVGPGGAGVEPIAFIMYDTQTNNEIARLEEGEVIDESLVDGRTVTFVAEPPFSQRSDVKSAFLDFGTVSRTENFPPYALYGDRGGDFRGSGEPISEGSYQLTVIFYDQRKNKGSVIAEGGVSFSVGDGGGTPPPPSPPPPGPAPSPPPPGPGTVSSVLETPEDAARFLIKAGRGGDLSDINALVGTDAASWLRREFNKPATPMLQPILDLINAGAPVPNNTHADVFWGAMLDGDDILRQRMVFALSQIFVVSDRAFGQPAEPLAYYQEILSGNAFGNFRDLLDEITYSPAMAEYLTYLRNKKANPAMGRVPDENYAREILQLFSIGLVALNPDGTPVLVNGEEVEIYDNQDIEELAKVFTGLSLKGNGFYTADKNAQYSPLQMFAQFHSSEEKRFLNTVIPANTPGDDSIQLALDEIFRHPNVAPFFSRQLIQRFTDSDPDPAYVARVGAAFESGRFSAGNGLIFGEGRRGDLQATLAAVLLDRTVFEDVETLEPTDGKVREPVLKFSQWVSAFNAAPVIAEIEYRLFVADRADIGLNQHPFRARSVFNFYRPGYVAPGTQSGEQNLTTPEFQIVNEGSVIGYVNYITDFIFNFTGTNDGSALFDPDYTRELALADDPQALIEHLNLILTGGQMNDEEIGAVRDAISASDIVVEPYDRQTRVEAAITLVMSTPSYAIIQ